jgi:hypothetical protein
MTRDTKNAALAALWIMLVFGIGAYYLPTAIIAVGNYSPIAGALVGVLFVVAFFLVFWLRGRWQKKGGS